MTHRIALSERAIEDLAALRRWIAGEAGPAVAIGYLARVEARIALLAEFPNRGTPRDDLLPGMRTASFEKRLIIAYRVIGMEVQILRVISMHRDLNALMMPDR